MPATIEKPEDAPSFAAQVKAHFQPPAPEREVNREPAPAKEDAPPKPAAEKPAAKAPAKTDAPIPDKEALKSEDAPPIEADTVFGTAPVKAKPAPEKVSDEALSDKLKEETAGMTEKAAAKWIKLRHSEAAATEEARKAREELKAAAEARQEQKPPEDAPKLEALTSENADLKARLDEAEKALSVTNIERTQKFRREITEPIGEIEKQAGELAARYEIEPKTVVSALLAEPAERADILDDLVSGWRDPDKHDLYQMAKDMDRLNRTAEKLREKARTDLSALEHEEKTATEHELAEQQKVRGSAAQRAWDEEARKDEALRNHEQAPEWNAALESARRQSREYPVGQDPVADGALIARGMMLSFAQKKADHFKSKYEEARKENEALLARIEADNQLDPNIGGGGDGSPASEDDMEGLTLGERAKRMAAKIKH
jgi:tetrahydromethanopterin S-methyltransferase subunit G